ncbi:MAG: hypothetical protein P4L40_24715 [Terracidiphilus sp.]|nr:hypothetical protein [Terracidiphilus sp.]
MTVLTEPLCGSPLPPGTARYDGGGIYRHVLLTVVTTPGPYIAPWGVYAPSAVTGPITWSGGAPFANAQLVPSVEVWSNVSGTQTFSLALSVSDPTGAVVGSASGSGTVTAGVATVWSPSVPIALPGASLWHLVALPALPALYTLNTVLSVGGEALPVACLFVCVRVLLCSLRA